MKFLKGLALALLSFLLFLSLTIFGLAFTLNRTILNPDFVTAELNRLDISSLVKETLRKEASQTKEPTPEVVVAFLNTFTRLEPRVKQQVNAAVYPVYDYLLGRSQELNLALILKDTLLEPAFVTSIVDEIDLSSLFKMALAQSIAEQEIPPEAKPLIEPTLTAISNAVAESEPWLKEQISSAAEPVTDYLLGLKPGFKVVISLAPIKENLRRNLQETLIKSPPAELAQLPQAEQEQLLNQVMEQFSQQIPATYEINESLLGTASTNIAQALAQAEERLEQPRQYIGYFQFIYKALMGFMVLLILGIILIHRQVKSATRSLGITFLTYGLFEYLGTFVLRYFIGTKLPLGELPAALQVWLPQFLNNLIAPLGVFSLSLLIGGAVLIIVSLVYQARQNTYHPD